MTYPKDLIKQAIENDIANKKYNPICITPDAHFEIVAKVLR